MDLSRRERLLNSIVNAANSEQLKLIEAKIKLLDEKEKPRE